MAVVYVPEFDASITNPQAPALPGYLGYPTCHNGNCDIWTAFRDAATWPVPVGVVNLRVYSSGQGRCNARLEPIQAVAAEIWLPGGGGDAPCGFDIPLMETGPGLTFHLYSTVDGGSPCSNGSGGTSWGFDGIEYTTGVVAKPTNWLPSTSAAFANPHGALPAAVSQAIGCLVSVVPGTGTGPADFITWPVPGGAQAVTVRSFGRGTAELRANAGATLLATLSGGGTVPYEQVVAIPPGAGSLWIGNGTDGTSAHSNGLGGTSYAFNGMGVAISSGFPKGYW